ncbi:MAG: M48 family metalloprotease, partial [Nocardioidaceae bacterium]
MSTEEPTPRLARGAALATAAGAAVAFVVLAVVLVPWDWVPGGDLTPMPVHRLFSPAEIARMEHHAAMSRLYGWSGYFLGLVVAMVLGFSPLGARLLRRLGGRAPWFLRVPIGVLVLLLIGEIVSLPFAWLLRREDLRVGLTHQAWRGWATDQAKGFAVSFVVAVVLLLVMVGLSRRAPRWWFAWAGGLALVLTLAGSYLYPVLVEPLFNDFTSMKPGPFKQSVFRLAKEEGVHMSDVLVADASRRTTAVNAYVSGFGSTRRVVVYDNLLKDLRRPEARVVIAHELGHAKHSDVVIGTVLGAVGSVFAVAVLSLLLDAESVRRVSATRGPSDPAVVALVLALASVG